jgi:peptidoglycan/xylan/chitin deacetylase (PgdA/CDA1 family)
VPFGRVLFWVLSLGALALGVRSALGHPPPLLVGVGAMVAYLGLIGVATLVPRLEVFGDVLWRVPGARGRVALTFDDGPSPDTTPRILDMLRARGQRATFFVIGRKAEAHPELLRAMAGDGHAIGVHGYDHDRLYAFWRPALVEADIERCISIVQSATGGAPVLFRPPIGQASPRTFAGARGAGVEVVGWSLRGMDGLRGAKVSAVAERVKRGLAPGAIVLLHDAAERDDYKPASLEALPSILDALDERGLRSVTVPELVAAETA